VNWVDSYQYDVASSFGAIGIKDIWVQNLKHSMRFDGYIAVRHMRTSEKRRSRLTTSLFCLLTACVWLPKAEALDKVSAVNLYNDKCSGCHTVGGGALVGPDLKPSTAWGETDLTAAVKRMEKNVGTLSNDEVQSLVKLLKEPQLEKILKAESEKAIAAQEKSAVSDEPASSVSGASLFYGRQPLLNGGMACAACHSYAGQGGNLAPDLTAISEKLSEPALVSACQNTSFKLMKPAYADHPVTRQEALHLARFLRDESAKSATGQSFNSYRAMQYGAIFAVLFFMLIAFGYRGRNHGVREKLSRRK